MAAYRKALCAFAAALFAVSLAPIASAASFAGAQDAITISNPGNGDYSGFRIDVRSNGYAAAIDAAGRAARLLPADLVEPLFADVATANHQTQKDTACAQTVTVDPSAATSVRWKALRWSNLGCSTDPAIVKMRDDAAAIARALYVQAYRVRTIVTWSRLQAGGIYGSGTGANAGDSSLSSKLQLGKLYLPSAGGSMPFTSLPTGGIVGSSPYASLPTGALAGGLPTSSLAGSLPTSSLSGSSPFSGSPYSGSPYSGGP